MTEHQTAEARYQALRSRRDPFLERARTNAQLTIPSLLPPEGYNGSTKLHQPELGLGARCVTHLSSKVMAAMLPPGGSVFRLSVPPEILLRNGLDSLDADTERGLSLTEKLIHSEIERRQWRQIFSLVLEMLIVTGNVLLMIQRGNTLRAFRLDQYVVVRAPDGSLLELLIEEKVATETLPPRARPLLAQMSRPDDHTTVYTHIRRSDKHWDVYQEIARQTVPGSAGQYALDALPYLPLRWTELIGEDYGRSKCDDHEPDLRFANGLAKAVADGAALAARNVVLQRPNAAGGINLRRKLAAARNGEVLTGNPEDITYLQFGNAPGMQFAAAQLDQVKREIAEAFLLNSAVRRNAERVTAYEVREMIGELEGTLGGIYARLAGELMYPLIRRLMVHMRADGAMPDLPEGLLDLTVLVGIEALGREAEVQRALQALQVVQQMPPEVAAYVKAEELFNRALTGMGFANCTRSTQEVQQIQQQQAMMQAMAGAAPDMASTMAEAAGAIAQGQSPQA